MHSLACDFNCCKGLSLTTSYCILKPVFATGSKRPDNDLRFLAISNIETLGKPSGPLFCFLRQLSGLDLLYRCLGFSVATGVCPNSILGDFVPLLIDIALYLD